MVIARPQAAPEDAKKAAALKDYMEGMFVCFLFQQESSEARCHTTLEGGSSIIHILHVSMVQYSCTMTSLN